MPIMFSCLTCGKKLKAPDGASGKRVRCPGCLGVMEVPKPVFDAEELDEVPESEVPDSEVPESESVYSLKDEDKPPARQEAVAKSEKSADRYPCPMCGELILSKAAKCRFCGEVFDSRLRNLERKCRGDPDDTDMAAADWVLAVFCCGIGCIMGIVWIAQGKPKGAKMLAASLGFCFGWNLLFCALGALGNLAPHR